MEPGFHGARPGGYRQCCPAQSVTVPALGVDVQFRRNLGIFEGEEVHGGVLNMHRVVFGLDDERGRGFVGWPDIRIRSKILIGQRKVAGIDDYGEVRTAAQLIGGVDRIVEALIEVRAQSCREVPASGEAQNADSVGVDVPLGRMRTDEAESPLRILEGGRGLGIGAGIRHPVFEQSASDAGGVKPIADLRALEIDRQDVITASGKNHDCGAGILTFRRVERESWHGNIAKTDERFAGDEVVFGGRRVNFRPHIRLGPGAPFGQIGSVVWPGAGCQAGFWAIKQPQMLNAARRSRALRMSKTSEFEVRIEDCSRGR